MGLQERLAELEEELARTQKNKATEYHIGIIKSKIAKLRRELVSPRKHGASAGGFDVRKSGDATVAIIGLPSVGKSTLLGRLTKAESKIAPYAFTTLKCIPGILEYAGAKVQVLDLPGIIEGAKDGKGRGREIISVARGADLILVLLDASQLRQVNTIERELYEFGIRLNQKPPNVVVKKLAKGGAAINSTVKLTKITENEIHAVLNEYRIFNANVVLREDRTIDQFIDVLEGNRMYIPAIYVVTKTDLLSAAELERLPRGYIRISGETGAGIEELKAEIYRKLELINIYTKKRREGADLDEPLVVKKGITVEMVCNKLHRTLRNEFRYAMVWGNSVKHQPQRVGLEHVLMDGDVIMIVTYSHG